MNNSIILVCIVEDKADIRKALKMLIDDDTELSCIGDFANAEEALTAIPELQPDVVLMDIGLPGMNGIECIAKLKPVCPRVQFMICTVYDEDEKIFDALAGGANSYLLKRSNSDVLVSAIKELHHGGSPMSHDIARKVVGFFHRNNDTGNINPYAITKRENEILNLLAKGFTYQQIANALFISPKTIKKHVYNIYEKLHVNSKMEAVNKYFDR